LLEDGDRRIYATVPPEDEGWVLAVFSVPESERQKRHVLRSRLSGLGFGTAAPGVWIAPARLYEETRHTLERLGLAEYVDFFRGDHLGFAATADAVARWWDLARIAKEHEAFLARHEEVLRTWEGRADTPPEEAYRDYLLALDSSRPLPYTAPGLPAALRRGDGRGAGSAAVSQGLPARRRAAGPPFVGLCPGDGPGGPPWGGRVPPGPGPPVSPAPPAAVPAGRPPCPCVRSAGAGCPPGTVRARRRPARRSPVRPPRAASSAGRTGAGGPARTGRCGPPGSAS